MLSPPNHLLFFPFENFQRFKLLFQETRQQSSLCCLFFGRWWRKKEQKKKPFRCSQPKKNHIHRGFWSSSQLASPCSRFKFGQEKRWLLFRRFAYKWRNGENSEQTDTSKQQSSDFGVFISGWRLDQILSRKTLSLEYQVGTKILNLMDFT